jgi:hypothetical protein
VSRIKHIFIVLFVTLVAALATFGVAVPQKAEAFPIYKIENNEFSDRSIRIYSDDNGHGKTELVRKGKTAKMHWANSMWQPKGCAIIYNFGSPRIGSPRLHGRVVNFLPGYKKWNIQLDCNKSFVTKNKNSRYSEGNVIMAGGNNGKGDKWHASPGETIHHRVRSFYVSEECVVEISGRNHFFAGGMWHNLDSREHHTYWVECAFYGGGGGGGSWVVKR